jgi:CRISPR/Cas system-associated endoribonuclease Cas2
MNKLFELLTSGDNFTIITKTKKIKCEKTLLLKISQYIRDFSQTFPDKDEIDFSEIDFINEYVVNKFIEKLKNPDIALNYFETWMNIRSYFKFIDFLNIDSQIMNIFDVDCDAIINYSINDTMYTNTKSARWYTIFNNLGNDENVHLEKIRKELYEFCKPACFSVIICKIYDRENEIVSKLNSDAMKVIERLVKHDTNIDKFLTTQTTFKSK